MFNRKPKDKQRIDHAIDATFDAYNPESDDALKQFKLLKGLHAIKAQIEPKGASADTKLLVLGNLVGIGIVVAYERSHVFASKAIQQTLKHPR